MDENTTRNTATVGDDDAILPDGWKPGIDFFSLRSDGTWPDADGQTDEAAPTADGGADAGGDAIADADAPGAPATGDRDADAGQSDADVPQAGETTQEAAPDGAGAESGPTPRVIEYRFDHTTKSADLSKLTDKELVEIFQKADAFDKKTRDDRFRAIYDEEKGNGMTDTTAAVVADLLSRGIARIPGADAEASPEAGRPDEVEDAPKPDVTTAVSPARDIRAELERVQAVYPDFREMPQDVMDAYTKGADLLSAVSAWRVKQATAENTALRRELSVLKAQQEAAARAPVRGGVTGGGGTKTKGKDPLLEAFERGLDTPY